MSTCEGTRAVSTSKSVRIQLMNTVNRLGARQWNRARSKILPCADWVKLDMLRRALKLHEGKLSLRHRSADQSPFGLSIGPTFKKGQGSLLARSLSRSSAACVLRYVLLYMPREIVCFGVSSGHSSVSLLARRMHDSCTTFTSCTT